MGVGEMSTVLGGTALTERHRRVLELAREVAARNAPGWTVFAFDDSSILSVQEGRLVYESRTTRGELLSALPGVGDRRPQRG